MQTFDPDPEECQLELDPALFPRAAERPPVQEAAPKHEDRSLELAASDLLLGC